MANLVRHNADESVVVGRLTDGEKHYIAAETELIDLLGRAVEKHIPQLAVKNESLEGAVGGVPLNSSTSSLSSLPFGKRALLLPLLLSVVLLTHN